MWGRLAAVAASAALLGLLGWSSGGYFPDAWGLLVLGFALVAAAAVLVADGLGFDRRGGVLVAGLLALAGWQLASISWSPGAGEQVLEAERTLVYAGAAAAALACGTWLRGETLVLGMGAGSAAIALGGLVTHLFPSEPRSDEIRLEAPIGYANAAGCAAALALLVSLAVAARAATWMRTVAGAAAPPLVAALYLSFSRGSMVALAAGVVVLVAVDRERLRTAAAIGAVAVPSGIAVVLAGGADALTHVAPPQEIREAGRTLAWQLGALAVAGAGVVGVLVALERRIRPSRTAQRSISAIVVAAGVLAVGAAVARSGGPVEVVDRAVDSFSSLPPEEEADLNRRLLSASGSVRADYWRVAGRMVEREPFLGEGAGSFERWWLQERPLLFHVRDAHNLYLETLAELGPVGLTLLVLALGAPFVGLGRARRADPLAAGAAGGYAAFLVHAAVDWDWELPVITLAGLGFGVALLVASRRPDVMRLTARRRAAALAALAPIIAAGVGMQLGNRPAVAAEDALVRGDAVTARAEARSARRWAPWAALPWQLEGEAELLAGRDGPARRALRRAVELDEDSWSAWLDLAQTAVGGERRRAAARVVRLNPLTPEAEELRAEILTRS